MNQVHSELIRSDVDPPVLGLSHSDALYEIVDGQIVEQPEMGIYSTSVASLLLAEILIHLRAHEAGRAYGEAVFILDSTRNLRRRPDVAFVSFNRWAADRPIPEEGDWEVIPDLAVEVVSPNDLSKDVVGKLNEYFAHGVREVWQIYPSLKQVWIFTSPTSVRILVADDTIDGGDLLPGFRVPAAALFRR